MGQFSQDVKDFLLGNDGSDNEPDSLKVEIDRAVKNGIITKSEATELMTALENVKQLAKKIDISWIKEVKDAEHGKEFDTPEEAIEYEKEKEEKRKEKEEERKRKEREARAAQVAKDSNTKKEKVSSEKANKEKQIVKEKERENT